MNTLLKEDLRSPLELMDSVLGANGRLAQECPLVFQSGFEGRVVAMGADEEVHSGCAVLLRTLVLPEGRLPVGLIGCVATDPAHRRRGLAGLALAEAERWLGEQGALLSLLWADDPRFYLPRGYRPIGSEQDVVVPASAADKLPTNPDARSAEIGDGAALLELYLKHRWRMERSVSEMEALLGCPDMSTLVVERGGRAVAYACVGRGRDLRGVLHEWAGDVEDLAALVRAHLEQASADGLAVMAPDAPHGLIERLKSAGATLHQGYLGLAKLLDPDAAARLLAELAGGKLTRLGTDNSGGAPRFDWSGPDGSFELDAEAFLDVLFGPRGHSFALERARIATGLAAQTLPLRPFCWGLDSI